VRQFTPWRPHPWGANGWLCRVVAVAGCAALLAVLGNPAAVVGQGFRPKTTKTTQPPTKGKTPPPPPPASKPLEIDPTKLPEGYEPPAAPPELMELEKPLITPEELDAYKKLLGQYRTRIRNSALNKEDRDIIEKGLKYRLYSMTLKENERNLHKLREDLTVQDLQFAGKLVPKAADVAPFRKYILDQIIRLTEPMLENSFLVRLQAVTLLGELELTPVDTQRNLPLEMYTPACELLIKVLSDPQQPLPVKIAAARSLVRQCRYGKPPVELKHKIASAAVAELAKTSPNETHWWYQTRLMEVLEQLDVTLDLQTRKPFIVNALLNVLNDPQRDWQARAQAAHSLGRVPFDPAQVQPQAVLRDIMQFALDLSKAAQQDPKNAQWKTCLLKLYLAFQPRGGDDTEATRRSRGGLLNSPTAAVASLAQQTYPLVVPIVNSVLNDKPIAAQMIQAVDDWVQKNKPMNAAQAQRATDTAATDTP